MSEISNSPLREPTIPELFAVEPMQLSEAHFEKILQEFRQDRHQWNQAEKIKQAKPKKGDPRLDGLGLADLDL